MFFFRALPILFFAQLGFSAPTMVGANTNAVYHLFRPVPKSNLQPMESDLLVATQSPRTVDAGHSILKIEGGVLFQQVANTGFFGLYFYDDVHYYFYLNSWKDIAVCYRLGIARKFEIQFDARTEAIDLIEPPLDETTNEWAVYKENSFGWVEHFQRNDFSIYRLELMVKLKWAVNETPGDFFQLSVSPFFGLLTWSRLGAGVGIPAEIKFHKKLRLGLMPQAVLGLKAFSPVSTNIFVIESIIPSYSFAFSHSALLRFLPEPYVNLFAEYAEKWQALPSVISASPSKYSAQVSLGIEFTFWKSFQLALAPSIGLFEPPMQFGAKAGLAYRF